MDHDKVIGLALGAALAVGGWVLAWRLGLGDHIKSRIN